MCAAKSLQSSYSLPPYQQKPLLSMGFSKQEYWSGFTCPPPGRRTLPDPGIDPASLCLLHCQVGSLPLVPPGKT